MCVLENRIEMPRGLYKIPTFHTRIVEVSNSQLQSMSRSPVIRK